MDEYINTGYRNSNTYKKFKGYQTWEYLRILMDVVGVIEVKPWQADLKLDVKEFELLETLGLMGWELVTILPETYRTLYFKRPK